MGKHNKRPMWRNRKKEPQRKKRQNEQPGNSLNKGPGRRQTNVQRSRENKTPESRQSCRQRRRTTAKPRNKKHCCNKMQSNGPTKVPLNSKQHGRTQSEKRGRRRRNGWTGRPER